MSREDLCAEAPDRQKFCFSIVMGQVTEHIIGGRNTVHLDSGWVLISENGLLRMMAPGTIDRVEVREIKEGDA